ncbi:MAG: (d)CMP kinase [Clostridia bacterium]|nr:(d)CMP kinase [Clostridia bacterium]
MLNVAIDGPAGAGKSTVAREVAARHGILYLDTGALYRAIGLFALEKGADTRDEAAIEALLPEIEVSLRFEEGEQHVLLCGRDVSDEIRTPDVSMAASDVSAIPAVREFLLALQRDIASENDCVMDGRDIGTVILPDADIKIFLTASAEERARRRVAQLAEKGIEADYSAIVEDIKRRDENDSTREISPLKPAPDAVVVDSTDMTFEQVVSYISGMIGELV